MEYMIFYKVYVNVSMFVFSYCIYEAYYMYLVGRVAYSV